MSPLTVTQVIANLQSALAEHGDLPLCQFTLSSLRPGSCVPMGHSVYAFEVWSAIMTDDSGGVKSLLNFSIVPKEERDAVRAYHQRIWEQENYRVVCQECCRKKTGVEYPSGYKNTCSECGLNEVICNNFSLDFQFIPVVQL